MLLLDIKDYDIVNYKKPSMFLIYPFCTFKCGLDSCQNYQLSFEDKIDITKEEIISIYLNNPLTHAIVMGGLEPFESFDDLVQLIEEFRKHTDDDIVIFTGFYEDEISDKISILSKFSNIIIKFGRYITGSESVFDEILGIKLASKNQYAKKVS